MHRGWPVRGFDRKQRRGSWVLEIFGSELHRVVARMLENGYTNSIIRHRTALKSVLAAAAPLMTLLAVGAHAGVSFYFSTNDFVSASASLVLRGTEDWS